VPQKIKPPAFARKSYGVVRVKRWCKRPPREAQATRHGKPRRVQGQIGNPGAARSAFRESETGFGYRSPRQMILSPESFRGRQNSAYSPSKTISSFSRATGGIQNLQFSFQRRVSSYTAADAPAANSGHLTLSLNDENPPARLRLRSGRDARFRPGFPLAAKGKFLDRRRREKFHAADADARRNCCRNRRAAKKLGLAARISPNGNQTGKNPQDISRRRADARRRRRVPRTARAATRPVGMSRVIHFVLDQANRPNPANRFAAL